MEEDVMIFTGAILALIPYVLCRGVTNRIARRWIHPQGEIDRPLAR